MKTKHLYFIWLGLYVLCALLGFIPERNLFVHILFSLAALAFYIPGIILLYRGILSNQKKLLLQVRIISLCSLLLTLLVIVLTILTVHASEGIGQLLNVLLNLVSVPMFCSYWRGVALFLWACLFISSFPRLWRK